MFLLIVLGIHVHHRDGVVHDALHTAAAARPAAAASGGELDLEQLGVKRLTVPRRVLEEMPLYTRAIRPPRARRVRGRADDGRAGAAEVNARRRRTARRRRRRRRRSCSPTCAICLDDFCAGRASCAAACAPHLPRCRASTPARELEPVPAVQDERAAQGACPPVITNAMVRRERMLRRMRDGGQGGPRGGGDGHRGEAQGVGGRSEGALWARGGPRAAARRRCGARLPRCLRGRRWRCGRRRPLPPRPALPRRKRRRRRRSSTAPRWKRSSAGSARAADPDVVAEVVDEQERQPTRGARPLSSISRRGVKRGLLDRRLAIETIGTNDGRALFGTTLRNQETWYWKANTG